MEVNEEVAEKLNEIFTEVIIAPSFSETCIRNIEEKEK